MEPRCGKSKAALDTVAILALKGEIRRVVVLGPLSVLPVWEEEIRKHFSLPAVVKPVGEAGYASDPVPTATWSPPRNASRVAFFLANYDKISSRSRRGRRWVHPWVKAIEKWQPDLVVCDESHALKRPSSNRARQVWRFVARLRASRLDGRPYVLLLTGTPNPRGYRDLFAQFRIMDPEIFGTAIADFDANYIDFGLGRRRWTVTGYRNKTDLLRRIRENSFTITRDRALDLPQESWERIPVVLPRRIKLLYEELAEEMIATYKTRDGEVEIDAATAATVRLRLRQITGGFTTDGTELHRAKLDAARDFLRSFMEQGRPLVVYASFLPEVHALEEVLDKMGARAFCISGATPKKDRPDAIRRFQQGKLDAIVFQAATGSLGIDLSRASDILFYSLPDAWDVYFQDYSRILGPEQRHKTTYYHLIARGTTDVKQLQILRRKGSLHQEMMGNLRGFLYGL